LSVGSWLLAGFSTLAGAAAASTVTGLLPGPAKAAKAGAAVLGPAMMTYPAVLVADTAVPAWHEAHRELPFVFAGAGLASGGALGMLAAPPVEAGPARAMAVVGSALELAGETALRRHGLVAEPYHRGRAGRWFRAGRLLTAAGAVGTLLAGGHRRGAAACGLALLAGSLCTRFAVFEAGRTSARDPKYTGGRQRERLSGQSWAAGAGGAGGGGYDGRVGVRVWIVDAPAVAASARRLLSAAESQHAERFAVPAARDLFLSSRALQRVLGSRLLHIAAPQVTFDRRCLHCDHDDHGKPRLVGLPWLDYSVSHSGTLVALAFTTRGQIGLDLEADDRRTDPGTLLPIIASPA